MNRLRAWGVPGFRRGTWWRIAVAIAGYAAILVLVALARFNPLAALIFLASAIAFVGVVMDAWGLRRRLPGAPTGLRAPEFWGALLFVVGTFAWIAGSTVGPRAPQTGVAVAPAPTGATQAPPPAAPAAPAATAATAATAAPAATAVPATEVPAVAGPATSNGLGQSRAEWDRVRGTERQQQLSRDLHLYDPGLTTVLLDGNVWAIEQQWPTLEQPNLASARARAAEFLPTDARLTRTYDAGTQNLYRMDVYTSEWMKDRFPSETWGSAPPGTLSVRYERGSIRRPVDEQVTRFVIKVGDRPQGTITNEWPREGR